MSFFISSKALIILKSQRDGNYCCEAIVEESLQQFTMEVCRSLEVKIRKPNVSYFKSLVLFCAFDICRRRDYTKYFTQFGLCTLMNN